MAGEAVAAAGFDVDLLPGRGLQRRLTISNVAALWAALTAVVRAIAIVRRYRPRVVVGFGGYASLPCVAAARLLRVPVVVHEQDVAPGLANRIGVRMGARPAVSLPGTPLPNATLTGNPVRASIATISRDPAHDPACVAVYGGAQGAWTINRAALGCYDRWRGRHDLAVHHVCGPRNLDECRATLDARRRPDDKVQYDLVAYDEHMDRLLAVGHARGLPGGCREHRRAHRGGGTRGAGAVAGRPERPSDAQCADPRAAGAAVLVPDAECDAVRLDAVVSGLLAEPERLVEMGEAARVLGRRDAAARVADVVEEHARVA